MGYELDGTSQDGRDEDDEDDSDEASGGNRLLGFMFGNVDGSRDLDVDYLDEVGLANILEIIVDTLKDRIAVSYLFLKPVSKKEAPDYLKIIKHPMDLSTIKEKVRKLEYKSRQEFRHDVWQITCNARKYNDGHNPGIPPLADQLLELCDYLLNEHDMGLTEAEDGIEYMDG